MIYLDKTKIDDETMKVGTIVIENPEDNSSAIYLICKYDEKSGGGFRIVNLQNYNVSSTIFETIEETYKHIIKLLTSTDNMLVFKPNELILVKK